MSTKVVFIVCMTLITVSVFAQDDFLDLSGATLHSAIASPKPSENKAIQVLIEEVRNRTNLNLTAVDKAPEQGPVIVLTRAAALPKEGFSIAIEGERIILSGSCPRGLLYGVGYLLRHAEWDAGSLRYPRAAVGVFSPAYPMRGHQLGYRYQANSYDTWDDVHYERYIRDLALFGCNSIENIPFQDDRKSPLMPLDRRTMNRRMSEICREYGLDYWIWAPAEFDLSDKKLRDAHLAEHIQLYKDCPELTGVFFPGGDPGENPPELVLPFIKELASHLRKHHPEAKVWLSLQWFTKEQCTDIYAWINGERPDWFGGLVSGPGSPSVQETRERLTKAYPVRHYPDITHTIRCQYPVQWWDPAFALTLGREAVNPRPLHYAFIHNYFAPYTAGFISYSDGINDDVNKAVWSCLGWNPALQARDILVEYASFFFSAKHAAAIADAILALEQNWEGSLAANGGVSATLALWQRLEQDLPELAGNWRWQTLLMRAYYDAYTRERLMCETELETEANAVLLAAGGIGAQEAMSSALAVLNRADTRDVEMRDKLIALFDALFHSVGLKSSVEKYQASGHERGCSLDFMDYPLNNRWFLEDEFKRIQGLPNEEDRVRELEALAAWEHPGPGSFYDDIGHPGKSLHVKRTEGLNTDPNMERDINPEAWWWDSGFSRKRLSWQSTMSYPATLVYEGLDPNAEYVLRITGYGEARPRANGYALVPTVYNMEIGEIKEFPIPNPLTAGGKLTIVWDSIEETHLNWRQQSRIAEAWLLKK